MATHRFTWLVVFFLATFHCPLSTANAQTPLAKDKKTRHVFVLHDGFHTIVSFPNPTWATEDMRIFLLKQGVAERDIVMMPCPFKPASFADMFPKAGFEYFLNCFNPGSQAAKKSYLDLHVALDVRGVRETDKLIWIGHSAGGQIGMTMAHLAGSLEKYPDLARQATPHPFDMVVTLGSPLGLTNDLVPPGVKRRHYYSPTDRVVHLVWVCGNLALPLLGYKHHRVDLVPVPAPLRADTVVRVFHGMEHPHWTKDEHVLMRILNEYRNDCQPDWRHGSIAPGVGPSLAGLMCRALEEQGQISIEDPFENK